MKTQAAVLYESNKPLVIDELEVPALKRGQVLAKILWSGICGAQYNEIIALKGPDRFLPHTLGHEASAIIEAVGEGVTKVKKGDYVVLTWIKAEGIDAGATQYKKGTEIVNAGGVTTFGHYSIVSENRVVKIPKEVPPDVAAILGCAITTGCGIVANALKAGKDQTIAVFGSGGIGLSVILEAKRRGCPVIIAVDIAADKLEFARRLGATHAVNSKECNLMDALRKIAPAGVDFTVDASGNKTAMETAFEFAREKTGLCVIAGNLSKQEKISLHPFELIKGKRIVGTWGGETVPDRDIPAYARAYLDGALPIDRLITHRLPFADINRAFDILKSGQAGRIVLRMNG